MTPEEKVALLKKAGVWDVIGYPTCIDKLFDLVAAHEREKQAEQEPVPTGATHYQPHQKTYYKRVSATEWYLWSCTGKGWLPSKGTSDSSEWIMLSPIQAHQPAEQAEQEPVMDYERLNALREGEQNGAEDAYFFVRPENDTPTLRKMFCQGFERGFHKGIKYAAPVSIESAVLAEREACAKLCDKYAEESSNPMNFAENCAVAIRARSE